MENLDKSLAEIVTKLQQLAEAHGADAVHLVGTVYQLQAIGALVSFLAPAAWTALVVLVLRKMMPPVMAEWRKDVLAQNEAIMLPGTIGGAIVAASGVISFIITLICASNLLSPVIWASAFDARVAIAARVLKLF